MRAINEENKNIIPSSSRAARETLTFKQGKSCKYLSVCSGFCCGSNLVDVAAVVPFWQMALLGKLQQNESSSLKFLAL